MYTISYIQDTKYVQSTIQRMHFFKEHTQFIMFKVQNISKNVYNFLYLMYTIFQRKYQILYIQHKQFFKKYN